MAKPKRQYCYDYPRPALTADVAVFTLHEGKLKLLLIRRKLAPFVGKWALPGGFVNEGERVIDAAHRELKEETGVSAATLHAFGTFDDPGRDPRGWTVTVAYYTLLAWDRLKARASDDAAAVKWFPVRELPRLAFDHKEIIQQAQIALRHKPMQALLDSGCLSEAYRLTELKQALEALFGVAFGPEHVRAIERREISSEN